MTILENFVQVMDKYATFEGRASRSEYWWYVLALFILGLVVGLATFPLGFIPYASNVVTIVFFLAVLIPSLAVTVRRLHDAGLNAWWLLGYAPAVIYNILRFASDSDTSGIVLSVAAVSVICNIVLIVLMVLPSNEGDNKYGPDPR